MLKSLQATVTKIADEQVTQKAQIEEVAKVAKAADTAVNGFANTDAPGDGAAGMQKAKKADVDWVQDSAMKLYK